MFVENPLCRRMDSLGKCIRDAKCLEHRLPVCIGSSIGNIGEDQDLHLKQLR